MGDFVFGESFKMLETDDWHVAIIMLRRALALLGPLSPVPWLAHLGFAFGSRFWRVKDWFDMIKLCHQCMDSRIEVSTALAPVGSRSILTFSFLEIKSQ